MVVSSVFMVELSSKEAKETKAEARAKTAVLPSAAMEAASVSRVWRILPLFRDEVRALSAVLR